MNLYGLRETQTNCKIYQYPGIALTYIYANVQLIKIKNRIELKRIDWEPTRAVHEHWKI